MKFKQTAIAGCATLVAALSPWPVLAAQQALSLPAGTTVQKVAPGQFRFKLPDGRTVVARKLQAKAGTMGSCTVYDGAGRKIGGGLQCQIQGRAKKPAEPAPPAIAGKKLPPSPSYVQIDDEVTWLPATLSFEGTAVIDPDPPYKPANLSPQPDPPGRAKLAPPRPAPAQ